MQFFKLKKQSKQCDLCKSPLGLVLFSSLSDDELRKDYCSNCFSSSQKPEIWWKTQVESKPKKILMTQYEQTLYSLLTEAIEEKNRDDQWVYFLAHYFKRRKVLQSQGECDKEGKRYEILECKLTQEVFVIPKTTPTPDILKEIVEELKNVHPS